MHREQQVYITGAYMEVVCPSYYYPYSIHSLSGDISFRCAL